MESPSFLQTLSHKSPMFLHTTSLEDVLCLATIIANKNTLHVENVDGAREEYLRTFDGDCQNCPYHENCLACFINE
jgi:hypothetical protein